MKILDFKQMVELDKHNQTEQAALLCYFHYKTSAEQIFEMKGIQELFSDAGYSQINGSRVKKSLIDKKIMRIPKGMKTSLEFVPVFFQDYDQKYSPLWEDPLKLKHTFFATPESVTYFEKEALMATGYEEDGRAIPGKYPQIPDLAASGLWSSPMDLLILAGEFAMACNGKSLLLEKKSALEMVKPVEQFPWTGLGVFMGGENEIVSRGWGESGQSMMKVNFITGESAVVMTNQNPGVDQAQSGIEGIIATYFDQNR